MCSLRNDMYNCMICFLKNKINMVKKYAQKHEHSASSGLRFLCHWMNGSETTMGSAVKAHQ